MCKNCSDEKNEVVKISLELIKGKPKLTVSTTDILADLATMVLQKTGSADGGLQLAFNVAYEMGYRKATADANAKLDALDKKMEVM